jgi:SAM-dependent methyltransferase
MADHTHDHVHLDEDHWRAGADHAALEAEVLLGFVTDTVTLAGAVRGPKAPPVRRVLDIGSGPGVGTCELARCFPETEVIAVDSSPAMLERVEQRAVALGLAGRVRAHLAELPDGLADLGPADVIWASQSLHHVGDEVAALRSLGAVLAPAGVLAIAEVADPLRILPAELDVGRPGLAQRIDAAAATWFAGMRDGLPGATPSRELTEMVREAGLVVLEASTATQHLSAPLSEEARRFAVDHLVRSTARLVAQLDEDDVSTLRVLTDPDDERSLQRRDDLTIDASRRIVLARHAGAT